MKRFFVLALLCACISTAKAQIFTETFDSNSMGWTEMSSKSAETVIKEGVMHMENKGILPPSKPTMTTCYTPIDVKKNFEVTCDAYVEKLNIINKIGIVFDCMDEYNFKAFVIDNKIAYYYSFVDNNLVGYKANILKIEDNKKTDLKLKIKSTYNKVEFFVNDMLAIDIRFLELISNGFGFCIFGAQLADFDNLTIKQ